MIRREIQKELIKLAGQFKAVAVTGPRQSGKTTLVRYLFKNKPYVNLESPDTRRFAVDDPRGFLHVYRDGAVIDEAQRAPELFSYMQQVLDEDERKGKFILTGSNNFLLEENVSQTLSGRIAYMYLLPFTLSELSVDKSSDSVVQMLKGSYPPVYDQKIDYDKWYPNYIRTYIERDVRQIKNISDLYIFEKFLRLCAGRTGQLLNMNSLAIETGVDSKTIGAWIGVLESSFVVFRLFPFHRSYNKRIVKMPKLYFYDTGLVCSLLGINTPAQLELHPLYGNLFENMMVSEFKKHCNNRAKNENLFFWRENTGKEIDLLIERGDKIKAVEIKSGKTITPEFFKGIKQWEKITGDKNGVIIYSGDMVQNYSDGICVIPWHRLGTLYDR